MKQIFFMLLLAASGSVLHAQIKSTNTLSEGIFNSPKPGSTNANFYFWFQKNNRVILEMNDVRQLKFVPNLDSLVQVAFQSIKPLKDSFKKDGFVRRIDYVISSLWPPQIRIITHANTGESFSLYKGELVQTKIDKDTLRIRLNVPRPNLQRSNFFVETFVVMLLVDNFDDLTTFPTNTIEECVKRVQQDLGKSLTSNKLLKGNFTAYYNMQTGKMFSPSKPKYIRAGSTASTSFVPTIQFGIQYARGSFIPSAAAGLQYTKEDGSYATRYFRAYWEPLFLFERDGNNKLITQRNDFITLRYSVFFKSRNLNTINTVSNISVGYLAGRRGNWFEPNTFKVGIPGFLAGSLLFEPEFFFNDFFRNFSPSLKMTLLFE